MYLYTVTGAVGEEGYLDLAKSGDLTGKNVYVNMTNKCPCSCVFCLRQTKQQQEGNTLWLKEDVANGNLDPNNSWEIMKLLEEINESGTTVVVVTHNREIVNAMQKRVITMKKGVIISDEEKGGYIDED